MTTSSTGLTPKRGHAHGSGHIHGAGSHRRRFRIWPLLSRRARLPPRPRPYPNAYVSQAVGGWSPHDLPDAYSGSLVVHTSRPDIVARGAGHADGGDPDRGLWAVHDAARLGLGAVRLGLRPGLVPRE